MDDELASVTPARHLIPFEIAAKICQKIMANQRFHAYIVIPQ